MVYNKKITAVLLLVSLFALTLPLMAGFLYADPAFASEAENAQEAEHDEEAFNPKSEIPRIINFLIVVGLLWFLLRKPLGKYFTNRRDGIQKMLDDALRARDDAETKLKEYSEKISNLEKEVADIRAESEQEQENLRNKLLEESQKASDRIMEQARVNVELERTKAMDSLKDEAAKLALELAEGLLKENISPEDLDRINSECIAGLRKE